MQDKNDFPDIPEKGVYCLVFKNKPCRLDAGRLRNIVLKGGYHIYVGSALGPGGLKRLKRHVLLSLKKDKKARWHVDYLSLSSSFELVCVAYSLTDEAAECTLAGKLAEGFAAGEVKGFGSGDCKCHSHLFYSKKRPLGAIKKAFSEMGMGCSIVCFD